MPTYQYRDAAGHNLTMIHSMDYDDVVKCGCGLVMWRVPQLPNVNWNGNQATKETGYAVKELIETRAARLDEYQEAKEKHGERTKAERKRLTETDPTYGKTHRKVSG